MRSIRQQITLGLLLGFALLLGAGGIVIYCATRGALLEEFDETLLHRALFLAGAAHQERNKIELEFKETTTAEWGAVKTAEYFQFFLVDGEILRKSRALGNAELPREVGAPDSPVYYEVVLPGGARGRAVGVCFVPRGGSKAPATDLESPQVGLVIAGDRAKVDRLLSSLGVTVFLEGVLSLFATVLIVAFVLRRGLVPLERVAEQAGHIDARSLQTRFPLLGMPTDLVPICSRLNDLLARLQSSFSELGEYAAKVAHELRTPLSILRLKVEQAGDRIPPELSEELQAELHQLGHVVDQSLLIAKAEQGRLTLQLRPFDLAALVADVAEDFSLLAEEQGRRVMLQGSTCSEVVADPKHARQIIHNLLANALKHGHGDIHVKLGRNGREHALTILNQVRREPTPAEDTLGLGLRVVDTLLHLQPGVRCLRRRGRHYFAIRLAFPAAPALTENVVRGSAR